MRGAWVISIILARTITVVWRTVGTTGKCGPGRFKGAIMASAILPAPMKAIFIMHTGVEEKERPHRKGTMGLVERANERNILCNCNERMWDIFGKIKNTWGRE